MRRTSDPKPVRGPRQRGFTLVEAIIVIVITGIVAGMVAVFVRVPVESYMEAEARAGLSDAADLALRRISRELRLAVPNSVTTYNGGLAIQFVLTRTGGRYFSLGDNPPAALLPLDFVNGTAQFDIAGVAPAGRQAIQPGDYIVIGNLGSASADVYAFGAGADNVSQVAAVNGRRVTLAQNRFATTQSPGNTFLVAEGTVTYLCTPAANGAGTLLRYFRRGIVQGVGNVGQLGTPALMTDMVAGCLFRNNVLPGQNAGSLMTLTLTLRQASGEGATLVRQTQFDNP